MSMSCRVMPRRRIAGGRCAHCMQICSVPLSHTTVVIQSRNTVVIQSRNHPVSLTLVLGNTCQAVAMLLHFAATPESGEGRLLLTGGADADGHRAAAGGLLPGGGGGRRSGPGGGAAPRVRRRHVRQRADAQCRGVCTQFDSTAARQLVGSSTGPGSDLVLQLMKQAALAHDESWQICERAGLPASQALQTFAV